VALLIWKYWTIKEDKEIFECETVQIIFLEFGSKILHPTLLTNLLMFML